MRNRRGLVVGIVILLVIAAALFALVRSGKSIGPLGSSGKKAISVNPNPLPGEIVVTGWTVCLEPTSGPGCVIGLAGDEGKTYALNFLAGQVKDEGLHVRTVGTYTPKATDALEAGALKYDGVLDVRVIQRTE
jgi:hypothetical protein